MKLTDVASLYADPAAFGGKEISVGGWIRTIRDSKAFGFIELNDGTAFRPLQIVLEAAAIENYAEIVRYNVGAAIRATGVLVLTPEARQPFELKAASVELEGASTPDFPMQKKRHSLEFLRTMPHLRARTNMSTPPSSPAATAKAPAICSA